MSHAKQFRKTLCVFVLCTLAGATEAFTQGTIFEEVGREKNLDPDLIYAVALAESAYSESRDGLMQPHPWTLRTAKGPHYSRTKEEAQSALKAILKKTKDVDVGLMQISVRWHAKRVSDPLKLLDPATNLRIGADILNEEIRRSPDDLIAALGRYHSREAVRRTRYGMTVYNIYLSLKEPQP